MTTEKQNISPKQKLYTGIIITVLFILTYRGCSKLFYTSTAAKPIESPEIRAKKHGKDEAFSIASANIQNYLKAPATADFGFDYENGKW